MARGACHYRFQVRECGNYSLDQSSMNNAGVVVGAAPGDGSDESLAFVYADGAGRKCCCGSL